MNKERLRKLLIGDFTWKRMIKSIIFIYAFFAIYVYFRADSMIFLPQPASYQDTNKIIKIPSADKSKISAIYLPNAEAKYTILYAHGNAEDLGDIQEVLEKLRQWGFSIFAYEYQGYGTSEGTPTESHAYRDIETAYNYLTQNLKIPPEKIIVLGRSVGGGSAVDLASKKPVAGLIVESAFTSAFRVVVPFPILPFDKFTNLQKIRKVKCPVLVVHGRKDDTIPFDHGEKLLAATLTPKLYLWVDQANHNDLIWVAGDKYKDKLEEFTALVAKSQNSLQPPK